MYFSYDVHVLRLQYPRISPVVPPLVRYTYTRSLVKKINDLKKLKIYLNKFNKYFANSRPQ